MQLIIFGVKNINLKLWGTWSYFLTWVENKAFQGLVLAWQKNCVQHYATFCLFSLYWEFIQLNLNGSRCCLNAQKN